MTQGFQCHELYLETTVREHQFVRFLECLGVF